jgi:hypothetical protein
MPLSYTFKNGYGGKMYVTCNSPLSFNSYAKRGIVGMPVIPELGRLRQKDFKFEDCCCLTTILDD